MIKVVNIKSENGLFYEDMVLVENISDLNEYMELVGLKRTQLAAEKICQKIKERTDATDDTLANRVEEASKGLKCGSIWLLGYWGIKGHQAKMKYVNKGYTIAINSCGGWMLVSENDVLETVSKKYSTSDIKISKFDGGRHYYAMIGNIEVKDKYGDNKWNTHEYAYEVAKEFLRKL